MGQFGIFLSALGTLVLGACADQSEQDKQLQALLDPTKPYCREYQMTITVGGKEQESWGQACRLPDGSWKVMK